MARWLYYFTLSFLLALPSTTRSASDPDTLTFFRAIRDKDTYGRKAVKYDHIVIKEATGELATMSSNNPPTLSLELL
jgi:hypothetical protein